MSIILNANLWEPGTLGAVVYGGATGALVLPTYELAGEAHSTLGDFALDAALPTMTLAGYGGAAAGLVMPTWAVSVTGTTTVSGTADLSMALPVVAATGTNTSLGTAELTFGYINGGTYQVTAYSGAVLSITLSDGYVLAATGTVGGTGSITATLPLYELTATGSQGNWGGADLLMPSLAIASTGQARLFLPAGTLSAVGTATVAVSYEAYAVNLRHIPRPRVQPVDEVTHYTNYPFERIVRYKDSYYGIGISGVYLLEGITDHATIPAAASWAVRTCMTDFDSVQNKTVEMAYLGGRFGPAATVTLYVGEASTEAYAYATPRDTTVQNYRQPFGRGIKARYYALGVTGSNELALDCLTLNVATLSRRI